MAENSIMQISPNKSLDGISNMIRQKEKELQDIHDLRCSKLELLVQERDGLLLESSRRFEQLKEDFQYNLTLIEARDKEIMRLENQLTNKEADFNECDTQRRLLAKKFDQMERKEQERLKKQEEDKIMNKKVFDELRDVIESMKWTAEEDQRSKEHEIDHLRQEISKLNILREESLETQRRDLTTTFENILKRREDNFEEKEQNIQQQINFLENKLEQIVTENKRLKEEQFNLQRKCEQLLDELVNKDDTIRQLRWQLEDENNRKLSNEDQLHRKIQQITMEYTAYKEKVVIELKELEKKMDAIKNDYLREKEFKMILEKRIEEIRNSAQHDTQTLEKEIEKLHNHELNLIQELNIVKEERETAIHRTGNYRVEIETLNNRINSILKENEEYLAEMTLLRHRNQQFENSLNQKIIESNKLKENSTEKEKLTLQNTSQRILELQKQSEYNIEMEREKFQNEIIKLKNQFDENLKIKIMESVTDYDYEYQINQLKGKLKHMEDTINNNSDLLQQTRKQLEEERQESAALTLRFRLSETQILNLQQYIKQLERDLQSSKSHHEPSNWNVDTITSSYEKKSSPKKGNGLNTRFQEVMLMPISSPAFSEDFGPISFPDSPTNHFSQSHQKGFKPNGKTMRDEDGMSDNMSSGIAATAPLLDSNLQIENERLKQIVREMRKDIETLKLNEPTKLNHDKVSPQGDSRDRDQLLDSMLKKTADELSRLRDERKKMVEVGTELKYTLFKMQQDPSNANTSLQTHDHLNNVFQFLNPTGEVNPTRSSISGNDDTYTTPSKQQNEDNLFVNNKMSTKSPDQPGSDSSNQRRSEKIWGSAIPPRSSGHVPQHRSPNSGSNSTTLPSEKSQVTKPSWNKSNSSDGVPESILLNNFESLNNVKLTDKVHSTTALHVQGIGAQQHHSHDLTIGTSSQFNSSGVHSSRNTNRTTQSQRDVLQRLRKKQNEEKEQPSYQPRRPLNYATMIGMDEHDEEDV